MPKSKKQTPEENQSSREEAFNALKATYNDLGTAREVRAVPRNECLPSPSISLNIVCNEAGFRPGSIIEYYGLEGTAKTTLAMEMVREAQTFAPDKMVAVFDPEYAIDLYKAKIDTGVNMDPFPDGTPRFEFFPDPSSGVMPTLEDLLDRIYDYAASGLFSLIIIDSIAACTTLWESKAESVTSAKFGGPSIPMSKAFKKIKAVCAKTGTVVWCVNQVRTTTVSTPNGQISKLEPGGGYALRYAATHRFNVSWVTKTVDSDMSMLRIKTDKVKYGKPWNVIEVPFVFGEGIDKAHDLVLCSARNGVVVKSGSWYAYGETRLGQGAEKAADFLRLNPELYQEIYDKTIVAALGTEPKETEDIN